MNLKPKNILLIDEPFQNPFGAVLDNEHYNVIYTFGIRDTIIKLFSEKIDLIVLDTNHPEIGGLKILKIIRRHKKTKNIPLIMLLSIFCEKNIKLSYKYGADLCIGKPALVSDILDSVYCLIHKQYEFVS